MIEVVMKVLPFVFLPLLLAGAAPAQGDIPLLPSGCGCLAGTRPTTRNALAAWCAGNPNFQIHSAIVTPCVPPGLPMFLALGFPVPPPVPLPVPPANPAYGLPCLLAMPVVVVAAYTGVTGTLGNPAYPLPIPPGFCGIGLALSAQTAVFGPGGIGLSPATGIVL
jgi:hypothetical protein